MTDRRRSHAVCLLLVSLLLLVAFVHLGSGCWLFREINACSTDRDCADGEVCHNNSGILVCVPADFLRDSGLLDGGADDIDGGDVSDEDSRTDTQDPRDVSTDTPPADGEDQDGIEDPDLVEDGVDDVLDDVDEDVTADVGDGDAPDEPETSDSPMDLPVDTAPCDGAAPNACGGCGNLTSEPGEPCGPCSLDHYVCDVADASGNMIVCNGTTYGNACNGCDDLANEPGDSCGPCSLDQYVCDLTDTSGNTTVCATTTYGNACDGCGTLTNEPDDPCGPCGLDLFECTSPETVGCDGRTTNDCGGCAALDGVPGEVCSCGGDGDASWSCSGPEDVVCEDDNDTFAMAEFLGNVNESAELTFDRWLDGPDDVDVYRIDVTEDLATATIRVGVLFERTPNPAGTPGYSIRYGLETFYRYNDLRAGNIVPYACGFNTCVFFDASAGTVLANASYCASGSAGFHPSEDLYGCRGTGPGTAFSPPFDTQGGNSIDEIDDNGGGNPDDRGVAYLVVYTFNNAAPNGCERYTFTVSF